MPECGSQITICDLPIRFDTYKGCSHRCSYCFITRANKGTNEKVTTKESAKSLLSFIRGERKKENAWADWNIPLHWGGMSDPFQPIEKNLRRSLECLKVFASTNYPFVVSTKEKVILEYADILKDCNAVVQISAICSKYDIQEPGAPSFEERFIMAEKLAKHNRVIIRVQPYTLNVLPDVLNNIKRYSEIGVYGVVVEGIKYWVKQKGMIKLGNDYVYEINTLKKHFEALKTQCHKYGLKFYSGENRLRNMGDNLCCCGVDGLGWKVNTANLNHFIYDKENYLFTPAMLDRNNGASDVFANSMQRTIVNKFCEGKSYKDCMDLMSQSKNKLVVLMPK